MGFLLFIIAYSLFLPLTIINFMLVRDIGYFRETALSLDKLANREFRTLWNKTLRVNGGYEFGCVNETISSALGKNQMLGALTRTGKILVWTLDLFEVNHCLNAITGKEYTTMKKLNQPTPVLNTILWKIGSFIYGLIIVLNENYVAIQGLGFTEKTESLIKIFGAVAYFLFTFFNFNQTTLNPKKT